MPRASPFRPVFPSLVLGCLAGFAPVRRAEAQQQAPVPAVNTANRGAVANLFNTYYGSPARVTMGWTGDLATGVPGDLTDAYRALTLQRINYFRSMSGVPGNIVFSGPGNAICQQAALMFAAQHDLSHTPPADWKWWTPDAAKAAGGSNIRCESGPTDDGPDAVTAFMADDESNNGDVGHRRWLIYPAQVTMASGSVPAIDTRSWGAAAIWVLGPFIPRPDSTPEWTAWPPAGYVPAQFVFRRWSFSYPDADFTNATVTMTKGGASLPVTVLPPEYQSQVNGNAFIVGDNTLVWEPAGNVVNRSADESYTVTVDNVRVAGEPRRFVYPVISMDPSMPSPTLAPGSTPAIAGLRVQVPVASRHTPTNAKIILNFSPPLPADITVDYTVGGTAIGGSDYQALSGTLVVGAGTTKAKIKAVPLAVGGNGTVTVKLANGTGYTVDTGAANATVTVAD